MPGRDSCCAVGCLNWRGKEGCEGIKFYRIPKSKSLRLIWIARINRADLRVENVTENTRLCSAHFVDGVKTAHQPLPVKFSHKVYPLRRETRRSFNTSDKQLNPLCSTKRSCQAVTEKRDQGEAADEDIAPPVKILLHR